MPLARCSTGIWASHDDLQPLSPLVTARYLAAYFCEDGCSRAGSRRIVYRFNTCESPSFGPRPKRGAWTQAIGTSRGGRTSKIHALADDQGRPVAFALTPGNIADISMAIPLMEDMRIPKRLLADKAYDADKLRNWLKQRCVEAVIPSSAARRTPYPIDKVAYRRRNAIERLFGHLKNWRRIATRYDRLASNYLAALALVSIVIAWC